MHQCSHYSEQFLGSQIVKNYYGYSGITKGQCSIWGISKATVT